MKFLITWFFIDILAIQQPLPIATAANEIFKAAKRFGTGQADVASIFLASNLKVGEATNGNHWS